ncbi:hypothetical protein EAF00_001081 [Botryotinia globosa]|nr:hypothetical protein EAF00_001081 [Botryotinia globosa]
MHFFPEPWTNPPKTILITDGSHGMGQEVGHQLSQKCANIVIVARDSQKLQQTISYIQLGAANPTTSARTYVPRPNAHPWENTQAGDPTSSTAERKSNTHPPPARHLIFTAPSKAALRSFSDSLSQEMNLYAAAFSEAPRVRVHTIFPATILTESYETENLTKHGLTLQLEEGDEGRTPHVIAERSIKGLEGGEELITTDMLTWLVKGGVLGGSVGDGFGRVILSWILAGLMGIVMVFVRADMNGKARAWGRNFDVARSAKK